MFNINISESSVVGVYEFSVHIDGTTVDFGLVFKEDLLEIVAEMEQELDVVKNNLT